MYHTATVKGGLTIRPVLFCGDISKKQEAALSRMGYDVRRLPPEAALPHAVCRHPDMLMAKLPSGKLLIQESYFRANEVLLSPFVSTFVLTSDTLGGTYPDDVKFNALPVGDTLYGGRTVSQTLCSAYSEFVEIRQGYAHCAACRVGNGIVTADRSLYAALIENGVDALLIESGHIALPPYGYGFIGGASLTLFDTCTAFFGKIEDHPDYGAMKRFADDRGVTLLSLSDEPLTDYGGGYVIENETKKT